MLFAYDMFSHDLAHLSWRIVITVCTQAIFVVTECLLFHNIVILIKAIHPHFQYQIIATKTWRENTHSSAYDILHMVCRRFRQNE